MMHTSIENNVLYNLEKNDVFLKLHFLLVSETAKKGYYFKWPLKVLHWKNNRFPFPQKNHRELWPKGQQTFP